MGAIGMYVFKLIYSGSEIVAEKTANLLIYYVTNWQSPYTINTLTIIIIA